MSTLTCDLKDINLLDLIFFSSTESNVERQRSCEEGFPRGVHVPIGCPHSPLADYADDDADSYAHDEPDGRAVVAPPQAAIERAEEHFQAALNGGGV